MNILQVGLKGLKAIIDDKKPAHFVIENFKTQYNFSNEDFTNFSRTIQGGMRHFFLLRYQACKLFPDFEEDDDEIYLLILAIYQLRYMKKSLASFKVIEEASEVNDTFLLRFDNAMLKEKLEFVSNHKFNLPSEVLTDIYKYDSLMFSTPMWLIKMWANQYGDDILLNLLHTNRNKRPIYVRRNKLKVSEDELLKENIYQKIDDVDDAYIYSSSIGFNYQNDAKLGNVFLQDLSFQMLLNKVVLSFGMKAIHLHGVTSGLSSNIAIRLKELNGSIDASFEKDVLYRKARYQYQRLGLDNVKAYLADLDMLRTYLPYNSYDLAFVTPNSSLLGQISKRPGLLLTIKKSDINKYIENEKASLLEGHRYLKSKGVLVYMVATINLNETSKLIDEFISEYSEYRLISSKQIFPFEYNSDGIYCAILSKGE